MLSKRKSKNLAKNLSTTLKVEIDPLVYKLEYTNNERHSKLSLPMYLSPPNSCHQRTSQNLVFTSSPDPVILPDCICQALLASFGKSLKLPKLQNTYYTLNRCGLYLGTNLLSRYNNERGKEKKTLKEFSLKDE